MPDPTSEALTVFTICSATSDVQRGNYVDAVLVDRASAAALVAEIQSQAKTILNPIEDKDPLVEYYNQQIAAELNNLVANAENLVARIQNGGRIRVLQYALERYVKGEINRQGVCPKMAHAFFIEFPTVSISSCSDLFGLLFFSATIWA